MAHTPVGQWNRSHAQAWGSDGVFMGLLNTESLLAKCDRKGKSVTGQEQKAWDFSTLVFRNHLLFCVPPVAQALCS